MNPKYTEDEVYKSLAKICESAGIKINYVERMHYNGINEDYFEVLAESDTDSGQINMPFLSEEYEIKASLLLGHELAHFLLDKIYCSSERNNSENNPMLEKMIESDCDRIGAALFNLAEMIAGHEEEVLLESLND